MVIFGALCVAVIVVKVREQRLCSPVGYLATAALLAPVFLLIISMLGYPVPAA